MKRLVVLILIVLLGFGTYQWFAENESPPPASEEQKDQDQKEPDEDGDTGSDEDETVGDPVENDAFKIESPLPNETVSDEFLFKGKARVFEAAFQYELKDGDTVISSDFLMASEGAPAWGTFETMISVPKNVKDQLILKIFVESAKDGSEINILEIPLKVE